LIDQGIDIGRKDKATRHYVVKMKRLKRYGGDAFCHQAEAAPLNIGGMKDTDLTTLLRGCERLRQEWVRNTRAIAELSRERGWHEGRRN
jgi:hypothetical protein